MQTICGRDPGSLRMLAVEVQDGLIRGIQPSAEESDLWLTPGLIDLQVNGFGGIDLNDSSCTPEAIVELTHMLAGMGTTTFVPTLVTAPQALLEALLGTIRRARYVDAMVHHAIPYVHLEGPSISPLDGYRGAHALDHVRPPSLADFDALQTACGGLIGMVTMSPHWEHSPEFVRALRRRGVVVAIGHTHASPGEIVAAVDAGARLSTHLGNGIAAMLPRHPNPIWTQLADDRLFAGFIADGAHVPAETLRVMLRAKGIERSVLVSDAVALAGSAAGTYHAGIGGEVVVFEDGSVRMRGSGLLAGSGIVLKDAVARSVALGACTLGDAVCMATTNPGRFVGGRGVLQIGAMADLLRFRWKPGDSTLKVADVLTGGRMMDVGNSDR